MQSNKRYKIGKVSKYDGYIGEIITDNNEYYFNKNDILDDVTVEKNDLVIFNSKTEEIFPQAYHVKKLGIKNTKYSSKE